MRNYFANEIYIKDMPVTLFSDCVLNRKQGLTETVSEATYIHKANDRILRYLPFYEIGEKSLKMDCE